VVVENFTPGTMKRLSLDYETVSRGHEDLIMISTCLMGQTGPDGVLRRLQAARCGALRPARDHQAGRTDRRPGPTAPTRRHRAALRHFGVGAAILERRNSGWASTSMSHRLSRRFISSSRWSWTRRSTATAPAAGWTPQPPALTAFIPPGHRALYRHRRRNARAVAALRSVAPLDRFADARYDALEARQAATDEIDAALSAWTAAGSVESWNHISSGQACRPQSCSA
jgi:crotonobetainyl-CoA:carnitine CoA-transferase CaiB-like acyl-CoA transferase